MQARFTLDTRMALLLLRDLDPTSQKGVLLRAVEYAGQQLTTTILQDTQRGLGGQGNPFPSYSAGYNRTKWLKKNKLYKRPPHRGGVGKGQSRRRVKERSLKKALGEVGGAIPRLTPDLLSTGQMLGAFTVSQLRGTLGVGIGPATQEMSERLGFNIEDGRDPLNIGSRQINQAATDFLGSITQQLRL